MTTSIKRGIAYVKTVQVATLVFSMLFTLGTPIMGYTYVWAADISTKVLENTKDIEADRTALEVKREHEKELKESRIR